jgi:hypothetical protein
MGTSTADAAAHGSKFGFGQFADFRGVITGLAHCLLRQVGIKRTTAQFARGRRPAAHNRH